MIICIILVWLGAACISLPPLLILGNEFGEINGKWQCSVCQNAGYQIYATLGSFYIPLIVMLFVYYQIFKAARRIVLDEKKAQTRLKGAVNGKQPMMTISATATPSKMLDTQLEPKDKCAILASPHHHHRRIKFHLAKERKASTVLGIIMSAFTICWLPFFILAVIRPFLGNEDDHNTLSSIFLWLGYANSLLNPIIYATLNRDFRKPFQEILYFR
jgi:5-hydroxytryptamine receptor 7